MEKIRAGIIGTGNIGTDLLYKIMKSDKIECTIFMGRREGSKGIEIAKKLGIKTSLNSVDALINKEAECDIVFDATTAKSHIETAKVLKDLGIYAIDLTPARVGKMCIPVINLDECMGLSNVNMVTCGGQGTLPVIHAIRQVQNGISYVEVVASIASKSAGIGTRDNIDEFTQTTKDAIIELGRVDKAKAIITLNPAEPPIYMHNTIFMLIDNPDMGRIRDAVQKMEKEVRRYVPGYKVKLEPTLENGRVTTMIEVEGAGDFLPKCAGNLDIITSAAIRVAERCAELGLRKGGVK